MSGKTVPKIGNPIDSISVSYADIESIALIIAVHAAVEASEILMTAEGRQELEILNFKFQSSQTFLLVLTAPPSKAQSCPVSRSGAVPE
jgi:hypothetical protein